MSHGSSGGSQQEGPRGTQLPPSVGSVGFTGGFTGVSVSGPDSVCQPGDNKEQEGSVFTTFRPSFCLERKKESLLHL